MRAFLLLSALLAILGHAAPSGAPQELSRRQSGYSEKQKEFLYQGATCDSTGPKDDLGCCAFPGPAWSLVLDEGQLPKGACFQPGSLLTFRWKVALQLNVGHKPDTYFGQRKISPTSATIRPGLGSWNPYLDGQFRGNSFPDETSVKQAECASHGSIDWTVPKAMHPSNFYPTNNVSWYYTLSTVSTNADDNQLAEDLIPDDLFDPFAGFVISDEAGCKLYKERLKEYRKANGLASA